MKKIILFAVCGLLLSGTPLLAQHGFGVSAAQKKTIMHYQQEAKTLITQLQKKYKLPLFDMKMLLSSFYSNEKASNNPKVSQLKSNPALFVFGAEETLKKLDADKQTRAVCIDIVEKLKKAADSSGEALEQAIRAEKERAHASRTKQLLEIELSRAVREAKKYQ